MGYILGLYRDNGKENGNYCNGVYRVLGLGMLGKFTPPSLGVLERLAMEKRAPNHTWRVMGT